MDIGKIKLQLDRVLLRSENALEQKAKKSGLFLSEARNKEGTEYGRILAIGPGGFVHCEDCGKISTYFATDTLKVNDLILFKKWNFQTVDIENEKDLLIIYARDILAVIEE